MSATISRMDRRTAIEIAKAFVAEIEPYTDQLIVAGSLRRRLAYVHDIEICAVPKVETRTSAVPDLFGEQTSTADHDLLDLCMAVLLREGKVEKRLDANGSPRFGETLKYLTYQGARVDLFSPCADRFGWILLLRTGPAAFSRQLVVPKKVDNGRPGRTKDNRPGLMPAHIRAKDGWLTYRTSGERIVTPDERAVFELFGLPYQEPWERC